LDFRFWIAQSKIQNLKFVGGQRTRVGFPQDDYTPYGYLETPNHTRNLHPCGVVRSYDIGFRWHVPAHAGLYGGLRETYVAGMRFGFGGAVELARFDRVICPYHSKSIVRFDLATRQLQAQASFQVVADHSIHARVTLLPVVAPTMGIGGAAHVAPGAQSSPRIVLLVNYTRLLGANGQWGDSGLVGRVEGGLLVLQGFEDGEAFVVWASRPWDDMGVTPDAAVATGWALETAPGLPEAGFVTVTGRRGTVVSLHGALGFGPAPGRAVHERQEDPNALEVILARGRTVAEARRRLDQARRRAPVELARKRAADASFWARAPRLEGDWPDHWRRGLVYDLETVRMMVRQPVGIYRHFWDAMQIQAPRVVLAEAAMDALLLAYADPARAQELLLGTFLDAPEPNVPCSREDGSYNMVAADGTVCGTAPAWGYPALVADWLFRLRPDRAWLEQLYPRLAAYLDWWLARRRDADGWLFYACSWESGQDDSPRFGPQPLGGGHPVRHVRPVDLHAAVAHAAGVLAGCAAELGLTADRERWAGIAGEFRERTAQLWRGGNQRTAEPQNRGTEEPGSRGGGDQASEDRETGRQGDKEQGHEGKQIGTGRYADFDTRAGALTDVDDVMLLAPLALGVTDDGRVAALRPALTALDPDQLTWPMLAWTAVEAALSGGLNETAATLAAAVIDRVYHFWDAREALPGHTLPGIACEYWPPDGRCGGEGYGWGAFTTHLLLHALVGLTPGVEGLRLRPNLPPGWRIPGRRYTVHYHWHNRALAIVLESLADGRVAVSLGAQRAEVEWGQLVEWGG
jgi:hypothetical protein